MKHQQETIYKTNMLILNPHEDPKAAASLKCQSKKAVFGKAKTFSEAPRKGASQWSQSGIMDKLWHLYITPYTWTFSL